MNIDFDNYLQILSKITSTDFEKDFLKACLEILRQENNPLKINNFACSIRELSRHILKTLAPDEKIKKCDWFEQQFNIRKEPIITRKQRIQYAIQKNLPTQYVSKHVPNLTDLIKDVNDTIDKLSKYTHVEREVFNIPPNYEYTLSKKILDVFVDFSNTIKKSTEKFNQDIEKSIDGALFDRVFMQYIEQLDQMASHHTVNGINFDNFVIKENDGDVLILKVFGIIETTLQWGSDGDCRRGDGLEEEMDFDFEALLKVKVNKSFPNSAKVIEFNIDDAKYYE